jgi:type IV secretion system protein VirD4
MISQPTAIFLVVPDENTTRHFFATLFIRNIMNDLIAQAADNGGKLKRKVLCLWDEFGNMPPVKDVDVLFSAARSRDIRFLTSLQSYSQLEKHYSRDMAQIVRDSCQMTMFTYVSPSSRNTAEDLSKTLGNMTIQSGSISQGKGNSQSRQMIGRALLTPDEIINMPQGNFVIMKAGNLPVKTKLLGSWKYLNKMPQFKQPIESKVNLNISYLNGDKIKNYVSRQQSQLVKGMFV